MGLVVRAGTLIDGTGRDPQQRVVVVVNEGRIAWIGPEGERHADGRAISSSSMFPGVAIALAVFGFHLLGDVLRGRLDSRLRGRA